MRGRWAAGIVPRNFVWIIQDHLAVSERPGGQTSQHRKVRRQEEIIWLKSQGFTRVVSLLPSPHNLHAYDERGPAVGALLASRRTATRRTCWTRSIRRSSDGSRQAIASSCTKMS
jgi:hypothetical protein